MQRKLGSFQKISTNDIRVSSFLNSFKLTAKTVEGDADVARWYAEKCHQVTERKTNDMMYLKIEENTEKRKRQIEALAEIIKIDTQKNDFKSLKIHTKAYEALISKDCPKKGQICLAEKNNGEYVTE